MEITSIIPFNLRKDVFQAMHQDTYLLKLIGPKGAGKMHLARYIHDNSARGHKPFICANNEESFNSVILRANGGTIYFKNIHFLNQIENYAKYGSVSHPNNPKIQVMALARVIIGNTEDFKLNQSAQSITLLTLEQRTKDLPVICATFLNEITLKKNKTFIREIDANCLKELQKRKWPGGLSELKAALETAVDSCTQSKIHFIPEHLQDSPKTNPIHVLQMDRKDIYP